MADQSYLDSKYFIDNQVYNCPFCKRRHVTYHVADWTSFDWTEEKRCWAYMVKCNSCGNTSMHLTYTYISVTSSRGPGTILDYDGDDLDSVFFHSVPNSSFALDQRIPRVLRDLITEAEDSLKMNFLTGASACARKAIYELLILQGAEGTSYDSRIKALKAKYPGTDPVMFDVLAHIQDMTSDKVHEQSWPSWDSPHLRLILQTLKAVLQEVYVVPDERKKQADAIGAMRERVLRDKKEPRGSPESPPAALKPS